MLLRPWETYNLPLLRIRLEDGKLTVSLWKLAGSLDSCRAAVRAGGLTCSHWILSIVIATRR